MEEKKIDFNSIVGMLLLGGILLWWMGTQKKETPLLKKNNPEQVVDSVVKNQQNNTNKIFTGNDSIKKAEATDKLGAFSYSATIGKARKIVLENQFLKLTIDTKGGQITEALVKKYKTSGALPLYLVKDNNASFNLTFGTADHRVLNTKDLIFEATQTKNGGVQTLSLKLKVSENQFLEYQYEMKPDDYMVHFLIHSQGLSKVINPSQQINLDWQLDGYRNEKSIQSEDMYTYYYYKNDDGVSYLRKGDKTIADVNWVAYKQHFFSSALLSETPFKEAVIKASDYKGTKKDSIFSKNFAVKASLALSSGELNYQLKWYYGPTDYKILSSYKKTDLGEIVDLGWGIFGAINRTVFLPVFNFLKGWISNYGLIIILMTIVVRIFMSPLVYKSYVSSAKMKVIRPEMQAINEKYPGKENALKRQQKIMAVQRKAGVSMLSGCIPAVLQMPIFFALYRFFPSNIDLRQKGFLWASDLSSYDVIFNLPFKIPFYGDHVSLFPILASVAIFIYMKMNQGQQMNMQAPTQEGMPDMSKMLKYMVYFSPIMMLFFFNNYASSLSLYYFVSNLLTITIMLVIKHYVIDEAKIHAKIEQNKKRPEKKKSKFRQRLDDAIKQAQQQQDTQRKGKK